MARFGRLASFTAFHAVVQGTAVMIGGVRTSTGLLVWLSLSLGAALYVAFWEPR